MRRAMPYRSYPYGSDRLAAREECAKVRFPKTTCNSDWMPLNLAQLTQDMDSLSRSTWDRVMIGDIARLKFREDSITDEILFTLMKRHPQLAVKRFSQNEEKTSGADWEWWVGSQGLGWFRLRIQAKRVHDKSYRELDHRGDTDAGHEFQYQTLIAGCNKDATYPFHIFFNGWPQARFIESFKSDHDRRCGPLDQDLWGCAAISSHTVKELHLGSRSADWSKRRSVPRYMPDSLPWSRLFTTACTNAAARNPILPNASPEQIFRHMHLSTVLVDGAARGEFSIEEPDWQQVVDNLDSTSLITELPSYAWKAQAAQREFLNSDNYIEENHNFIVGPDDDPYGELPDAVLILDVEIDSPR